MLGGTSLKLLATDKRFDPELLKTHKGKFALSRETEWRGHARGGGSQCLLAHVKGVKDRNGAENT
ncbi:hypothetical protein AUF62_00650 [archaeon 13_1_20CM_52_20]|nr:MAG: hypothetical protein AUF62_00650 [archaeon 13_1_20CM_52_20]